ncbi:TetR/AcrR family transcriptional regulator [Novosphingobium sp. Leaf2]|uniref:TetR/AcrR family transcriptional regulator n=1 Tax=Novosphingobium sp. Leaf2 TaxID=1735670 RepID=UPI0006FB0FBF|nr:TetR/AcrR family transcriptional regulator [Novosphingobium sp. Leaf2]KQM22226.1 transcriptional regulator [Novosphingobium sp. Leaf2]
MRVSRKQMDANRVRILEEAGRLFRERGFDAVTVADVMKAAGLTHGGFYGHFESKDALIAAVVAHSLSPDRVATAELGGLVDAYLSPAHRDTPAQGCPTASLAGLMRLQTPEAKAAMASGVEAQLARLVQSMPAASDGERRQAAIGQWAAMVGAVVLARAVGEVPLADEILSATRSWIKGATETPT